MGVSLRFVLVYIFIVAGNVSGQGLEPCVPTDPPPGPCPCSVPDAKRGHPDDCVKYFQCLEDPTYPGRYEQIIKSCFDDHGYGWGFDKVTFACSLTPTCIDTALSPDCPATGEVNIADGDDCNSYVVCNEGVPTEEQCPVGWTFDYPSGQCLLQGICYPGSSPPTGNPGTPPPPTTTTPTPPVCPTTGEASIPDPSDCNSYFSCLNGDETHSQCPPGWKFDWISSNCLPYDGTCWPNSNPPTGTPAPPPPETTTELIATTTATGETVPTTVTTSTQEPITTTSSSTEMTTTTSTTSTSSSDTPVTLPSTTTSSPTTSTSTTTGIPPEGFCPPGRDIVFPHPTSCSLYYECITGVPCIRVCPEGNLFDFILEQCVPRLYANCLSGCGWLHHFTSSSKLNLLFLVILFLLH